MRRDRAPGSRAMMRDALVDAKLSVGQSREARGLAAAQLAREQAELETVRRRGQLAAQINDAETAAVASRFEQKHAERIAMLERKLAALDTEVALGERELEEMTAQFKAMHAGDEVPPSPSAPAAQAGVDERDVEHNALRREAKRSEQEADATARLEEMKRKMGM